MFVFADPAGVNFIIEVYSEFVHIDECSVSSSNESMVFVDSDYPCSKCCSYWPLVVLLKAHIFQCSHNYKSIHKMSYEHEHIECDSLFLVVDLR